METQTGSSPIFDRMSATSGLVIVDFDDDQPRIEAETETGDGQS